MRDLLREAPFYQEIWEEGHKAGLKEGLEKGRLEGRLASHREECEEGHQATQRSLQALRETLLQFVEAQFPSRKMVRLAKSQVALIDDPETLRDLILKVGLARTAEKAQHHLLNWPDPQEIQN